MNARPIRCLITAGPTREFFDPVRFVSNPSSGKMGYALAVAARECGWRVDLVSGPVALAAPAGVTVYPVVTGAQMLAEVERLFESCDVLVMCAAVCDFRPVVRHEKKVKKDDASALQVAFERVPDILAKMAAIKAGRLVVGFAAETHEVEAYAWGKLREKHLDYIVANDVSAAGCGFGADTNAAWLLGRDGTREFFGSQSKEALARSLLTRLAAVVPQKDIAEA